MRGLAGRVGGLAAVMVLVLTGAAQADSTASPARGGLDVRQDAAYFAFRTPPFHSEFIVKITEPGEIENARAVLEYETDKTQIYGRIAKRTVPYNPRWSFHYLPETVRFVTEAPEVCDANTDYVEDHLDEAGGAFLPGLYWCPWYGRLTREVKVP